MNDNRGTLNVDIKLRVLFPTFLNEATYPFFAQEKERLIARIRQIREEDREGRELCADRYPGGYTSFYSRDRLYHDPVFANLVKFIQVVAEDYARKQYWDLQNFQLVMTQLWCNINPRHSGHRDHIHPYSQISGVMYLQCDSDSPAISLKDPRLARWVVPPPVAENRPENTLFTVVPPVAGKLLMFPAWLDHGVPPNQADLERISLSYNLELQRRQ